MRPAPDEAVSPVLGTILMVAITVVLTTVTMVLVSGLHSNKADVAPVVMQTRDEANDRLVIVRADSLVDLSRLRIEMSAPGHFAYNAIAGLGSTAAPANTLVPLGPSGTIQGGDIVSFCTDTPSNDVQVLLQDPVTNKLVATTTFNSLAACA